MAVKIYGPYRHRNAWRCYLRSSSGARTPCETRPTREAALRHAEEQLVKFQATAQVAVCDLSERYLEHLRRLEREPQTLKTVSYQHQLLLGPLMHLLPVSVTARLAKERYLELAASGCAAATHRRALVAARSLWSWAAQDGLVRQNPWTNVRPVGKVKRGKPQLTIDEAQKLREYCLTHALIDDGAFAVLIAQEMALRSSEIVWRCVRDVDAAGTLLRVGDISDRGKTEASKRPVRIPTNLQPAFRVRCERRAGADSLLPTLESMKSRRQWLGDQLERICRKLGIPEVCPHALRGQWASIAYEAGALPELVAAALGHANNKTTEQHYATPEAVQQGRQVRRQRWLKSVD